jgi:hypothetical protein
MSRHWPTCGRAYRTEMERAWAAVKALPEVTITIDLFAVGLVFFRPNAPKQHFTLWL